MRIYLDLVIILNFMVDFLLILGTNRLAGYPPGAAKAAWAAALGAAYSALCLLPGMDFLGNGLWRVVFLCLMAGIAFGWNRGAIQRGAVFLLLSMALGGLSIGFGKSSVPILLLAAGGLWLLCRVSFRGSVGQREYVPVELTYGNKTIRLIALRDTGNTLRDPLTGEQVLVAGADVAEELMGLTAHQVSHPVETLAMGAVPGMRLIPYRSVGQPGSMLLAMRFENVQIGKNMDSPLVAFAPEVLGRGEVYRMLTGGAV